MLQFKKDKRTGIFAIIFKLPKFNLRQFIFKYFMGNKFSHITNKKWRNILNQTVKDMKQDPIVPFQKTPFEN